MSNPPGKSTSAVDAFWQKHKDPPKVADPRETPPRAETDLSGDAARFLEEQSTHYYITKQAKSWEAARDMARTDLEELVGGDIYTPHRGGKKFSEQGYLEAFGKALGKQRLGTAKELGFDAKEMRSKSGPVEDLARTAYSAARRLAPVGGEPWAAEEELQTEADWLEKKLSDAAGAIKGLKNESPWKMAKMAVQGPIGGIIEGAASDYILGKSNTTIPEDTGIPKPAREAMSHVAAGVLFDPQADPVTGENVVTESTPAQIMRIVGSAPVSIQNEFLVAPALQAAGVIDPKQRGSGTRDPLLNMAYAIEHNEGLMEMAQEAARTFGLKRGDTGYKLATLGGFILDVVEPDPTMYVGEITGDLAKLSKLVPKEKLADATKVAIASRLFWTKADLVDIAPMMGKWADQALAKNQVPKLKGTIREDMVNILATTEHGANAKNVLDALETGVRAGDPQSKAMFRGLVEKAYERRIRARFGSSKLVKLTNDIVVTPKESARIQRKLQQRMERLGIPVEKLNEKLRETGSFKPTRQESAAIKALARMGDIQLGDDIELITDQLMRDIYDRNIARLAGPMASTRYALGEHRPIMEQALKAVPRVAKELDRNATALTQRIRQAISGLFAGERKVRASKQVEDLISDSLRYIESARDRTYQEWKKFTYDARRLDPSARPTHVFSHLIPSEGHTLVSFKGAAISRKVMQAQGADRTTKFWDDIAKELEEIGGINRGLKGPDRLAAAMDFVEKMHRDVRAFSDDILDAFTGGESLGRLISHPDGSTTRRLTMQDRYDIVEAYQGIATTTSNRQLKNLLRELGTENVADVTDGLFKMIVKWKTNAALIDVAKRLRDTELGIEKSLADSSGFSDVLDTVFAKGAGYTLDNGQIRVVVDHPMADAVAAFLTRHGFVTPYGGTQVLEAGDLRLVVPGTLYNDITEAMQRAGVDRSWLHSRLGKAASQNGLLKVGATLISWFTSAVKTGATTGLFIINSPYFVGNLTAGPLQMFAHLGYRRSIKAFQTYSSDPGVMLELFKRATSGMHWFQDGVQHLVIRDKFGRAYTMDELQAAISRFGLDTSQVRVENVVDMLSDIKTLERGALPSFQSLLQGKLDEFIASFMRVARGERLTVEQATHRVLAQWESATTAARAWTKLFFEVAHASDQFFRLAVFVSEIKAGRELSDAAKEAREALYDYGAMTQFEKQMVRHGFLFYSFARKNLDSLITTLITNPQRVSQMMRFTTKHREGIWGEDPSVMVSEPAYRYGRLILAEIEKPKTAEGFDDPRVGMNLLGTQTIPMAEAIGTATMLANLATAGAAGIEDLEESSRRLQNMLHPIPKYILEQASNEDSLTGKALDDPRSNMVPAALVELDRDMLFGMLSNYFQFTPMESDDVRYQEGGRNVRYYAAETESWRRWRTFLPVSRELFSTLPAALDGDVNKLIGTEMPQPTAFGAEDLLRKEAGEKIREATPSQQRTE